MTKQQMLEVGQYIVDVYGGVIEEVRVQKDGSYMIYADDHGEGFCCEISPKEWADYAKEAGVK